MVGFFKPQYRSLHLFLLVHQNFSLSKRNLLQYRFCRFSLHCVNGTLNKADFRLYPELWYECWTAQTPNQDHTCLHAPRHAFLSAFELRFQSPSPSRFRHLFLDSPPEPASPLRYHLYKKKKSGSGLVIWAPCVDSYECFIHGPLLFWNTGSPLGQFCPQGTFGNV